MIGCASAPLAEKKREASLFPGYRDEQTSMGTDWLR